MSIKVYTDGSSCIKKKLCGYGVYYPNKEFPDKSEKYSINGTNQRAELYAIYDALITITKSKNYKTIDIYTDSKYSIGCLTNWIKKWKKNDWKGSNKEDVKNQDIIRPIDDIMSKFKGKIIFHHVKAHTNGDDEDSKNNEMADSLAKAGSLK